MKKILIIGSSIIGCILVAIFLLIFGSPGFIDYENTKDLSGNYLYHDVAGVPLIDKKSFKGVHGDKGIPDIVVSYKFNDSFIIALQKDYPRVINNGDNKTIIRSSNQYYKEAIKYGIDRFWIIRISTDSVLGPLTLQEYYLERKRLNVPNSLKLNINN